MSERQTDPDCAEPTTVLNKQGTTTDQAAHPIGGHNALEAGSSRELHVAPGIVDLKHTDVDATWQNSRLPGLFGLYWDCASKACLRLQVCINIEADSSLGHRLNIYLFIPPERIQQLNVVPGSKLFGPNTETLDFILSSPPFLVVPNQAWEPRDSMSIIARDLIYNLARQLKFTLCIKIPGHVMSGHDLSSFCVAASAGRLSTCSDRADPKRLYSGQNIAIEGQTLRDHADVGIVTGISADSAFQGVPAPEYTESPPALGLAPAYSHGKKRRRQSSSIESAEDSSPQDKGKKPFGSVMESLQRDVDLIGKGVPRMSTLLESISAAERSLSVKLKNISAAEERVTAKLVEVWEVDSRISAILAEEERDRAARLAEEERARGMQHAMIRDIAQISNAVDKIHGEMEQIAERTVVQTAYGMIDHLRTGYTLFRRENTRGDGADSSADSGTDCIRHD